ncbi:hypothetical protein [Clostridium sp. L74]|nr:hypothetical protein [Clostridium sp. L74]KOR24188.1 hypothetical protein ND00_28940 [Clostridium sp. L74]
MGCEVTTINNDNLTLDSREVAQMMGRKHWEILRKLEGVRIERDISKF